MTTITSVLDDLAAGVRIGGIHVGNADASIFEDWFRSHDYLLEIEGRTATFHTPAAFFDDAPTATLSDEHLAAIRVMQAEGWA